jgi:hypothetical protein
LPLDRSRFEGFGWPAAWAIHDPDRCRGNFFELRSRWLRATELVQVLLLQVGQDVVNPAARLRRPKSSIRQTHTLKSPPAVRKKLLLVFMIQHGKSNLLQIVFALRAAARFSGSLDRGQQQSDQNANDRDHHQEFHERKGSLTTFPFNVHRLLRTTEEWRTDNFGFSKRDGSQLNNPRVLSIAVLMELQP